MSIIFAAMEGLGGQSTKVAAGYCRQICFHINMAGHHTLRQAKNASGRTLRSTMVPTEMRRKAKNSFGSSDYGMGYFFAPYRYLSRDPGVST
jgi:hypothetical protein